jgi:hypothetical protein
VSDLTGADVREIKQYLAATCAGVERWLPGPEWRVGWQSEAAGELANAEVGPAGPWGEAPVRAVYLAAALYLAAVLECLGTLGDSVTAERTAYVPNALARAAMEAGWHAWWLLEPGIGARRRVARFLLIRCSGARYLARAVESTDPGAGGVYGETPEMVAVVAAGHGLECGYLKSPRYGNRKVWSCGNDELPPYTERGAMFEEAMGMRAAYGIYSASAHAEWHAVIASWRQVDANGDMPALLVSRPDRVAAWAAVIASAGFVCVPARRALELLGLRGEPAQRVAELGSSHVAARTEDGPARRVGRLNRTSWPWRDRERPTVSISARPRVHAS